MKRMYEVQVSKQIVETYEIEASSEEEAERFLADIDFYNLETINGRYIKHCKIDCVDADIIDLEVMVDGYMEVE